MLGENASPVQQGCAVCGDPMQPGDNVQASNGRQCHRVCVVGYNNVLQHDFAKPDAVQTKLSSKSSGYDFKKLANIRMHIRNIIHPKHMENFMESLTGEQIGIINRSNGDPAKIMDIFHQVMDDVGCSCKDLEMEG